MSYKVPGLQQHHEIPSALHQLHNYGWCNKFQSLDCEETLNDDEY